MKLVEMYFALNTVETQKDYDDYIKRYEKELNELNEYIIIQKISVMNIKRIILEVLQDFDIKEVLDQAETLFNDVLRHEAEIDGKLSPNMITLGVEVLTINREMSKNY